MGPFLEDIVYEPIRSGAISWPVAFECLIIYLRMVEDGSGKFKITSVLHEAGGMDSIRAQATVSAHENFAPEIFRGLEIEAQKARIARLSRLLRVRKNR